MKNLKIYKKAVIMVIAGTMTLNSTSCISKEKSSIKEEKMNNEIDIDQDRNSLGKIKEETFIADGLDQKTKIEKLNIENEIHYLIMPTKLKKNPFPQAKTVKRIDPYQKVTVLENHDSWKLIKSGKSIGYIKSKNVKKIKGKYIEIDISKQNLKLYNKKGKVVLKTKVVTGIPTNPDRKTVLGSFKIYSKEQNRTLRGRDYETPVHYWMPFYKAYGIHDAYWRSEFGKEIYKKAGSHGCVNLPKEVAPKVYQKVNIGTPVLIHN